MARCVFFDVDETLISGKSLLLVFEYYCQQTRQADLFASVTRCMSEQLSQGVHRDQVNKYFYSNFKGIARDDMVLAANSWFAKNYGRSGFFCEVVVDALRFHQRQGDRVVLLSGSFLEALVPIARYLQVRAGDCLCIALGCLGGVYTGGIVGVQTIGEGKKAAVEKFVADNQLSLKNSFAYGDHVSDKFFMEMAANPVVVGDDSGLMALAKQKKWRQMTRDA